MNKTLVELIRKYENKGREINLNINSKTAKKQQQAVAYYMESAGRVLALAMRTK